MRDMSCGGARVEGAMRLLPGTHSEVHVIGATGRQLVRSRIVWARVLAVEPLVYEAALLFDVEVALLAEGYCIPSASSMQAGGVGSRYPPVEGETGTPHESRGKSDGTKVGRAFEVSPDDGMGRLRNGDD
ncbi:MAG: hypothetical protein ABL971_13295 [Vicinamibacterales bacterium]